MARGGAPLFGEDAVKPKAYVYPITENTRKYAKLDLLLNPIGDEYFTWITDPAEADLFYSPCDLGLVWWDSGANHGDPRGGEYVRGFVEQLPCWHGNGHRHFFHDYSACSDDWGLPAILFRAVKSKHDPNPRTISVPHTVDDFFPRPVDFSTLPYDICFVGRSGACEVRRVACEAIRADKSIRSYMTFRDSFWGYVERDDPKQAAEQRTEFISAMAISKLVLSPRGVELDAYRTWEGMSAARPTIWIGDDYELPFLSMVDYSKFMFYLPEAVAPTANASVKDILDYYTNTELQAMGEEARHIWLEYFTREAVPKVFAHYLRKFL